MLRGKLSNIRQLPVGAEVVDQNNPMPVVGTGEALTPATYTTTAAYVEVPGTRFDTQQTGHMCIANQVAGITHDVKVKVAGSFDGIAWSDIIADDETGTPQSGAEVTITVPATVYLMLPAKDGRSCFRYYALFAKDAVGASHGVVTAHGFSK